MCIHYEFINCKELCWFYGDILSNYQKIKNDKLFRWEPFLNNIISRENNDCFLICAFDHNQLIGFINYHINVHYKKMENKIKCEINFLVINPNYRNKKIGTTLLNKAFIHMNEIGINSCDLLCSKEFDEIGFNFWLKYGKVLSVVKEKNYNIYNIGIDNINEKIQVQKGR